jgi:serine/threonine protein phosphatase PrpC
MFGKGLQGKSKNEADKDKLDENNNNNAAPTKHDLSGIGQLPVSAVANALRDSFNQVDEEILANDEYEYQGSTAVAVVLHEANDGTRTLLSANIGDSRGILSRDGKAVDLTRDHKPNDDKEKARILAMGEKIEWDHYCKVHRVRNLSLSRAVGDRFAKPAVSGEVEIQRFPIQEGKDEFVLLASDGLWDVMTSEEVVAYVHKRLHAAPKDGADIKTEEDMQSLKYLRRKNMSRFIANEALRRGSGDNISVVIVWLKTS